MLEIAGGIVLAVVILCMIPFFLALIVEGISWIVGAFFVVLSLPSKMFRSSAVKAVSENPPSILEPTPEQIRLEHRKEHRIFLRKHYADQINPEKRD